MKANREPELIVEARVVGYGKIDPSERLVLEHQKLQGADFSGRKLRKFCAIGSRFERCRFDNMVINDCSFGSGTEMSYYNDCIFDGMKFDNSVGGFARFERCSFRKVKLHDWFCFGVEFIDCVFSGRLTGCVFNRTVKEEYRSFLRREHNEFHGNDFSGADLVDSSFRSGIDLSQQRLPSGPHYVYLPDAAKVIQRVRPIVEQWPDPEMRRHGLILVEGIEWNAQSGQRQQLLRSDSKALSREATDRFFTLLRQTKDAV